MYKTSDLVILGTRGVPARYGGFETLAEVLSAELSDDSRTVEVLPPIWPLRGLFSRGIFRHLETPLGTSFAMFTMLRKHSAVFLVVNPVNFVTVWLLSQLDRVTVLHMDGRDDLRLKWPWPLRNLLRVFQKACLSLEIPIIFDSAIVREQVLRNPARVGAVHVVPYGGCRVCESSRIFWHCDTRKRIILMLGRLEAENQIIVGMQAFLNSRSQGTLRLVTVARSNTRYLSRVTQLADNHSQIELTTHGEWDKQQLCLLYRDVSAVIHGHTVGGTNPSLVLALCHGTPVLAHDNPYNREVAGSLARYWKNEAELTKLLDEFDPMTWPYDQAAVDDFNRRYNWDDVVEKYRQLLGL